MAKKSNGEQPEWDQKREKSGRACRIARHRSPRTVGNGLASRRSTNVKNVGEAGQLGPPG